MKMEKRGIIHRYLHQLGNLTRWYREESAQQQWGYLFKSMNIELYFSTSSRYSRPIIHWLTVAESFVRACDLID